MLGKIAKPERLKIGTATNFLKYSVSDTELIEEASMQAPGGRWSYRHSGPTGLFTLLTGRRI